MEPGQGASCIDGILTVGHGDSTGEYRLHDPLV